MSKFKQVVDFCFDIPTIPVVDIDFSESNAAQKISMCWYNKECRQASIMTTMVNPQNSRGILNNPSMQSRYSSGNIMFSLEKKVNIYSLNHRNWLITVHVKESKKAVDLSFFSTHSAYATQSSRNTKLYAAWLMSQFAYKNVQNLREIDWSEIYEWCSKINNDNACTIIITDGVDTVFYQGSDFTNSLYYVRSCPPHDNNGLFQTGKFHFQIDALDLNHTVILVSTSQILHKDSKFFNLNQMMVISSGEIIFNKDPNALWRASEPVVILPEPIKQKAYLNKVKLLELPVKKTKSRSAKVTVPAEIFDDKPRIYSILHHTKFTYDLPVYLSRHLFRLQPTIDFSQSLLEYELVVLADGEPVSCIPSNYLGAFGNYASFIEIDRAYKELDVICRSVVSIIEPAPKRFDILKTQTIVPLIWMPWDRIMMQAYLVPPELPESELRELSGYALSFVKRNGNDIYAILNDINRTIYQDYEYVSGSTTLETTAYEVYTSHRGVCQDFANLFICLARLLNIPARYRTGYVYTAADYQNQAQGDATHAWLEVFLPYVGWQGFDPTNFCTAEKNHIRVASGRTFKDTAPTSGTIFRGGGREIMDINVQVILLDAFEPSTSGF